MIVVFYSNKFDFFWISGKDALLIQYYKTTCGFRVSSILVHNNQWFYSYISRGWIYLLQIHYVEQKDMLKLRTQSG